MPTLYVTRTVINAVIPNRASVGAAGFDLTSSEPLVELQPGARTVVSTGLIIEIPEGHYGRVAPRSGLTVKHGLDIGAGVIDSDYRGVVGVVIFNHGDKPVSLESGSRIAQLIIEKIALPRIVELKEGETSTTIRGASGFGSTGCGGETTVMVEDAFSPQLEAPKDKLVVSASSLAEAMNAGRGWRML